MKYIKLLPEAVHKILGIIWLPVTDTLKCSTLIAKSKKSTKRGILSILAQIFDPLGLVSPTVFIAKMIIQRFWQLQLIWNASIPIELHTKWCEFYEHLYWLELLNPEERFLPNAVRINLYGFSDASEVAYDAAIYCRTVNNYGNTVVHFLCSKSRIALLKNDTLPRLELCAALLLADLYKKVQKAMHIDFNRQDILI